MLDQVYSSLIGAGGINYMQSKFMRSVLAISSFSVAQLIALLPASASVPPGSYQQSCENWEFDGTVLYADCWLMDGRINPTQLDVSRCIGDIANINGRLSCTQGDAEPPGGSYQETCTNISMTFLGRGSRPVPPFGRFPLIYQLEASCKDVDGNFHDTSIRYSTTSCLEDIYNDNGVLREAEGICAQ